MILNHLKIAIRNIRKSKFNSVLNIVTLSLAITCCILIYLYVNYQLSFDRYHNNTNRVFRLVNEIKLDRTSYDKGSSIAMLRALKADFPQVERASVSINRQSFVVDVDADTRKRFRESENISFADTEWFDLFKYNFIKGSARNLDKPGQAIITQKLADKYFNGDDPIGRTLSVTGNHFTITGLIADPVNTDMKADLFLSISSFAALNPDVENDYFTQWGYIMSTHDSFVLLNDAKQKAAIEKAFPALVEKHIGKDMSKWFVFHLMPLEGMHLDTRYVGTVQTSLLTVLALIGVLIMGIAAINYINLVIAQQAKRSAEIGVRKILGGSSKQIFMLFVTDSFFTALIAVILSFGVVLLTLPFINTILFADEPLHILSPVRLMFFALAILIFITLAAGVYPSIVMSRTNIFRAFKSSVPGSGSVFNSRSLLIIQNMVAQVLIIGTIVIMRQVDYLKNTDKGFKRDAVVMVPFEKISVSQRNVLTDRLNTIPGIESFSFCYFTPGKDTRRSATVKFDTREWEAWPASFSIGDSAYLNTFGINVKYGRTIAAKPALTEYLVNETMASRLMPGDPQAVLGKRLWAGDAQGIIVGVTQDFNLKSLRSAIEPVVFMEDTFLTRNVAVKLSGINTAESIAQLKTGYESVFPKELFTYQFVDEQIAALYKKESMQQKFIWISAAIAIVISTLGLLGLIALITVQKTKEIGIRKVLGASVSQIIVLLSSGFIRAVFLAFIIAAPIAWWLMNNWLQQYPFRVSLDWTVFLLGGAVALSLAIITVSVRAARAAMANPVENLRAE